MAITFGITWDYRCPFARNVNENILTALAAGADWDVNFIPFSLGQAHVEEGGVSVWDDPSQDSGIIALQAGVYVRDNYPDKFLDLHRRLLDARHSLGKRLTPEDVKEALEASAIDSDTVFEALRTGDVLLQVQKEHEEIAATHAVWGVPTFIVGKEAAFVRLMTGSPAGSDAAEATRAIEHIVSMLDTWPALNEFKHTTVGR